jgi:putative ABC transport system substrate-binding protein
MERRTFVVLLGSAAAVWPIATRAQTSAMPVVGFLGSASPDQWAVRMRAFHEGLREAGYIEGRNVAIEYRWAEGRNEQLPKMAADLVSRQVTVIAALGSSPAALAAKAASTTIPIIFEIAFDPVELGLVASLARPGGNVTGATSLNSEVEPKRLELMHELVPTATVVGLLVNPTNSQIAEATSKNLQAAASKLGLEMHVLHASAEHDFDAAFAKLVQLRAAALVIGADPLFSARQEQLAALAVRYAIPACYPFREFALAGGLFSYGSSFTDMFRTAAAYVGRVLRGEKPADLPVQQSTKVDLILNLKTAKALGIAVPLPLIGRADELIE